MKVSVLHTLCTRICPWKADIVLPIAVSPARTISLLLKELCKLLPVALVRCRTWTGGGGPVTVCKISPTMCSPLMMYEPVLA